jgi:hypothetical protein
VNKIEKQKRKLREQLSHIATEVFGSMWFPTNLSVKVENPGGRPRFHVQAFNGFVFDRRFGWGVLRKAPYAQFLIEFRDAMYVAKAQYDMGELAVHSGTWRYSTLYAVRAEAARLQAEMFQRMRIPTQMMQFDDVPIRTWP